MQCLQLLFTQKLNRLLREDKLVNLVNDDEKLEKSKN